jgi:hypothetical protein
MLVALVWPRERGYLFAVKSAWFNASLEFG